MFCCKVNKKEFAYAIGNKHPFAIPQPTRIFILTFLFLACGKCSNSVSFVDRDMGWCPFNKWLWNCDNVLLRVEPYELK